MGQGLLQLLGFVGKFPHEFNEFKACGDAEWAFILTGWNEKIERENKAIHDAKR
jgi:hypothetical protein